MQDVEDFAREKDLEDILPLLRKGALVAQAPDQYDSMPELDDAEKQNLREEVTRRWKHPAILYFTIILNSIAAAIQGWDQTGSNGASLSWPTALGIRNSGTIYCANNPALCARNQWLEGVVNSCPYFAIFVLCVAFLQSQTLSLHNTARPGSQIHSITCWVDETSFSSQRGSRSSHLLVLAFRKLLDNWLLVVSCSVLAWVLRK